MTLFLDGIGHDHCSTMMTRNKTATSFQMTLWWGTIISFFKAAAISPLVSSTLIRVALQKSDTKLGPLYNAALIRVAFQKSGPNLGPLFKKATLN
jgi:hypothetical protein